MWEGCETPMRTTGLITWQGPMWKACDSASERLLQSIEESSQRHWFITATLDDFACHRLDAAVHEPKRAERSTGEPIYFRIGAVLQENDDIFARPEGLGFRIGIN